MARNDQGRVSDSVYLQLFKGCRGWGLGNTIPMGEWVWSSAIELGVGWEVTAVPMSPNESQHEEEPEAVTQLFLEECDALHAWGVILPLASTVLGTILLSWARRLELLPPFFWPLSHLYKRSTSRFTGELGSSADSSVVVGPGCREFVGKELLVA